MIIEEIKNAVRNSLYKMDNDIIFHFEENKKTDFPYAIFSLKNFSVEHFEVYNKQKLNLSFELIYAKSPENKVIELVCAQEKISKALLPTIKILNKNITLDNVKFGVLGKQLVMTFDINIYTLDKDENDGFELMQTLDLTIKEDKNA